MAIHDFCAKWQFHEITTQRMEGRKFSNGQVTIGWTHGYFTYVKAGHTGSGGVLHQPYKLHDLLLATPSVAPGLAGFGFGHYWQQKERIFQFILGYLDENPRKGMFLNYSL